MKFDAEGNYSFIEMLRKKTNWEAVQTFAERTPNNTRPTPIKSCGRTSLTFAIQRQNSSR